MATNSCTPNDSETESYLSATSSEDEALEDVVENMEKVKLKLQLARLFGGAAGYYI